MVLVVSNRISVAKGWEENFEKRWKERKWHIAQSPGFIKTEVLRPMKGDHYVVMTYWRSKEDFDKRTESQAFMEAHANTPPKEAFTAPSKLELHEIIAESPTMATST
ncbi:antibiotic biosynthesis monooxygenase [Candidatus Bathyarchaeota archaeon]|nr:MAG: antibiotic biosynthesis monooxygenase [Candidatus Bathyarchaeota archaeon]